jgi:hypothetical protein
MTILLAKSLEAAYERLNLRAVQKRETQQRRISL